LTTHRATVNDIERRQASPSHRGSQRFDRPASPLSDALIAQSDPAEYVPNLDPSTIAAQLRADSRDRLQNGRSGWLSDAGGSEHGAVGALAGVDGEAGEEDRWRSAASSWRWYWRVSTPGSFSAGAVPIERGHRMLGDVPGQHREKITARR